MNSSLSLSSSSRLLLFVSTAAAFLVTSIFALPFKNEHETKGVVLLDAITFRKIIPNDNFDVVVLLCNKRQIGDYGTDSIRSDYFNFAYKANTQGEADHVLFSQVIINGGENAALAEEMGAEADFQHPILFVYPAGHKTAVKYPPEKPFHMRQLSQFVSRHSSLYYQMPGQMKIFDAISDEFMDNFSSSSGSDDDHRAAREALLQKARRELQLLQQQRPLPPDGAAATATNAAAVESETETETAQYYVKLMENVLQHGNSFIKTEIMRLSKLVRSETVSAAKKRILERHLNILHHFEAHAGPAGFDTAGDSGRRSNKRSGIKQEL